MMEIRMENSVETPQGDFEEPEEQIDQLAEDGNDDDIIDENTQETVKVDSLNQNNLEDVMSSWIIYTKKDKPNSKTLFSHKSSTK